MERRSTTTTRITVNGKEYTRVEDMPPDVRRQYEQVMSQMQLDADGNGIPDVFEGKTAGGDAAGDRIARSIGTPSWRHSPELADPDRSARHRGRDWRHGRMVCAMNEQP